MKVLIIDDDPIVGGSLKTILGAQEDINVTGLGLNGTEALQLFQDTRPDILLMDIQMPELDGLSAAEKILTLDSHAKIVFLTTFPDDEYIVRALNLGARGYLIKQDVSSIAPALRAVMAGQSVLEGEVVERAASYASAKPHDETVLSNLSAREREVVKAVSEELDNSEIAAALYMSEGTVRNHISSILSKLGLKNRTQIAVYFYRNC